MVESSKDIIEGQGAREERRKRRLACGFLEFMLASVVCGHSVRYVFAVVE